MTRQNLLIALVFAAVAAGLVRVALEVDRREQAYVAANPAPRPGTVDTPEDTAPSGNVAWLERWRRGEPVIDRDAYRLILVTIAAGAWLQMLRDATTENPEGFMRYLRLGGRRGMFRFISVRPDRAPVAAVVWLTCTGAAIYMTFAGG